MQTILFRAFIFCSWSRYIFCVIGVYVLYERQHFLLRLHAALWFLFTVALQMFYAPTTNCVCWSRKFTVADCNPKWKRERERNTDDGTLCNGIKFSCRLFIMLVEFHLKVSCAPSFNLFIQIGAVLLHLSLVFGWAFGLRVNSSLFAPPSMRVRILAVWKVDAFMFFIRFDFEKLIWLFSLLLIICICCCFINCIWK